VSANDDTIPSAKAVKAYVDLLELKTKITNGGLINGFIRVSVASNNLTVAISTSPTSQVDPTASNPVYIWVGGVLRSITAALSFTRNGGTSSLNMGSAELATKEVDLFPYLQWNTTTSALNLLASRLPYARKMSDFVNSASDEKGVLGIVNYNSNDDVVLVDRFSATSNSSNNFTATGNIYGEPSFETRYLNYTPTWVGSGTNPSIGNGTLSGKYIIRGSQMKLSVYVAMGSTTTYGSGSWAFQTPMSSLSGQSIGGGTGGGHAWDGNPRILHTGVNFVFGAGNYAQIFAITVGNAIISPSHPFTWSAGTYMILGIDYELT